MPNGIEKILSAAYPWMEEGRAGQLAALLAPSLGQEGSTGRRIRTVAQQLTGAGLPVSGDLLVRLCGGSKTTATAVLRAVFRENLNQALAPRPDDNLLRRDPTRQETRLSAVGSERLEPMVAAIAENVDYLLGQLKWIQRSVDTERQLARLQAANQSSNHPHLRTPTAGAIPRQEVIGQLLSELNQQKILGQSSQALKSVQPSSQEPDELT